MPRWVPFMKVPFRRRVEITAVLVYALITPFTLLAAFYAIVIPIFWFFTIPYLIWMIYYDKTWEHGGKRLEWVRNLRIWSFFRDYFPVSLVASSKLDPKKNYIFGYHPHGIISLGAFCNFATNANGVDQKFPGLTIHPLTLESNFKLPFFRDVLMSFGMSSVSRKGCDNILSSGPGKSIMIVVGGAAESLDAHPGNNELYLKRRKGFVRLALSHGAGLVPMYSFGENDVFDQVSNPRGSFLRRLQQKILQISGIAPPLFNGRGIFTYDFGLLPHRHKIVTVVGDALEVPRISNPSDEVVDFYHQAYIDSLTVLFNKYKDDFGSPTDELKIN
ncbi:diacylglycerol O-acyltransferase 2 [Cavenderia fasciculata]|uniref:Acyltransferase n=1 Tax=Cavenderia fasciculata TaxID=261658 RepID=F4QEW3_CACFS|nr:diacylglycerol O-acyltransferase 2 [Cavenderia fasciculata]EGG14170.1 diacylglycerol O-acyltransferase 2 [Cavenderia fasciculata]|eukprot:XP_004350878.1 diacylglycerol O-acyltransferase 2 [Cavenderia fasciculata]